MSRRARWWVVGLIVVIAAVAASPLSAALIDAPTQSVPSANGQYILVLFGYESDEPSSGPDIDPSWSPERIQAEQDSYAEEQRLEATYPYAGLYRNDGSIELLWPIDDDVRLLCGANKYFVANDGEHLVVAFEDWDSSVGNRGSAVATYRRGQLLTSYEEDELMSAYYTRLATSNLAGWDHPHGTSSKLDDEAQTFELTTNWGDVHVFDINTGKLISSYEPFRFLGIVLTAIGAIIAAFAVWYTWRRCGRRSPNIAQP